MTARVLLPSEVAEAIGSSESYVRSLAREGKIEHLRVGRSAIRFTEPQVEALIAYLTKSPAEAPTSLTTARSRARSRS